MPPTCSTLTLLTVQSWTERSVVGHDLDAVALVAVAEDREVRQREPGQVHAGRDDDLDDRRAVGDLRDDLGAAEVDAERALHGTREIDDDRRAHRVAGIRQMGDDTIGQR